MPALIKELNVLRLIVETMQSFTQVTAKWNQMNWLISDNIRDFFSSYQIKKQRCPAAKHLSWGLIILFYDTRIIYLWPPMLSHSRKHPGVCSFCWNFTERQILLSLCSVDFHTLTLQLPIQTPHSVAPELQVFVSSLENCQNLSKTSTPQ